MSGIPGTRLSSKDLKEIRELVDEMKDKYDNPRMNVIEQLLKHIEYLEGPIYDALSLGELEQYKLGRIAGLEEAAKLASKEEYAIIVTDPPYGGCRATNEVLPAKIRELKEK